MTHPHHQQVGQPRDANGLLTAVCGPTDLVLAQAQTRFQLPGHELERPAFLVYAHDLSRRQCGQIGHQEFCVMGADVSPFFTQYQGDIPDMTQTQARVIGPKGSAAFPPMRSGNPGALVILARHMGHEMFERLLLHGLPSPGDRKDKALAACPISLVPVLAHPHVRFRALGCIPTYNDQLGPTWGYKLAHHLAKHGIFTAIPRVALGQHEPKAHREALTPMGKPPPLAVRLEQALPFRR